MRDSRGGLFSYRDFKKPPISIYTIYSFLVFPVKILSPFPTRRPSERPPAPPRVLLLVTAPRTTRAHSLSLGSQYLTPTEGACTDMAEDAATATPASLVRISFAAPRPCLRQLQLPTAPNHFCVYLSDVNYTSSTTASFSLTPTSPPSVLPCSRSQLPIMLLVMCPPACGCPHLAAFKFVSLFLSLARLLADPFLVTA